MHRLRSACLVLALLSTGEAFAQDDLCPTIRKLKTLAASDFRSIDGGPVKNSKAAHATTLKLPRAYSCGISLEAGKHAEYWCSWDSTEDTFERRLTQYAMAIGDCLNVAPRWTDEWTMTIPDRDVDFTLDGSFDLGSTEIVVYVQAR